jgi:hypothetical protein
MVNISFSLNPDRYQKLYRKLQIELQINKKATMSDIVNRYIEMGFAYEDFLKEEEDEAAL